MAEDSTGSNPVKAVSYYVYQGMKKSGWMYHPSALFLRYIRLNENVYNVSFLLTYPGRSSEEVSSLTCVIFACLSMTWFSI